MLTLNRGVPTCLYVALMDAGNEINLLSTAVGDNRRRDARSVMLAMVTDHPALAGDANGRTVYCSAGFMQPWIKVGVLPGNLRFDYGKYRQAVVTWTALNAAATVASNAYTATPNAGTLAAKVAAIAAAAKALPTAFDATKDYTMITPDWNYSTGVKM